MEKNKNYSGVRGFLFPFSPKGIPFAAVLIAMSIVFGKYLSINVGPFMRFGFENLPLILGGIFFGPIMGAVIGVISDLIGCLLVGYTINPLVMLGATVVGMASGIVFHAFKRIPYTLRVFLSVFAAHLFGSVLIKTPGLWIYYDIPLTVLYLWRCLNYLIVFAAEMPICWILVKNKGIRSALRLPPLPEKKKTKVEDRS